MALTPIISDYPPSPTRNNFTGVVGYIFEPLNNITATYVGRPIGSIFNQSHEINIWQESGESLVATAEVSPSSDTLDQYAIAQLNSPIILQSGLRYRIASNEYENGDNWQDYQSQVTGVTNISIIRSCYESQLSSYPLIGFSTTGTGFVWPNIYIGELASTATYDPLTGQLVNPLGGYE